MSYNLVQKFLPDTQYHAELCDKTQIVLHYTAGSSVQSALDWWQSTLDRVATAYLVDLDGTVYQVFKDPAHWAWHLGVAPQFGKKADKQSIGIEMVNVGVLKPYVDAVGKGSGELYWWAQTPGQSRPWARLNETARVALATPPFRGNKLHAAFPEEQVQAVMDLVVDLMERYSIPKAVLPQESELIYDAKRAFNFEGVLGHHNYRGDKIDPGPWFPWERLREHLKS